jgi:prolyl-tRNA synthetase
MKEERTAIVPTRAQNYPEWYQQVVKAADLAENSPVRGCMVIKPWGYSLWENMQKTLDRKFKETGHKNAYFPLFIPLKYMEQEAKHVEGFAKECAVVTHHRLELNSEGKLVPAGPLDEPLVVRPTSETIIGEMFSKWVKSYRDLPLLINQWANVVRWEMRPRLFLRTAEFLWQEGHTVHATAEDAQAEVLRMLDIYADFAENYMAMPVIKGEKSEGERFPGAVQTYSIEAMMQDGKALQAGTSHFLGQNFAKASNIKFLNEKGEEVYAWTTSWGVSTRLIGGLVMTHGDDDGLILPPKLAPAQIVIMPVIHKEETRTEVLNYAKSLLHELQNISYNSSCLQVEFDDRELRGGEKNWGWIKNGIPLRIEIGAREVEANKLSVARRDRKPRDKALMDRSEFVSTVVEILDDMQKNLLERARLFRDKNSVDINDKKDFYDYFKSEMPGFARVHFAADPEMEKQLKEELNITIRNIPLTENKGGKCIFTGKTDAPIVIFARAY